jgi:hypothetical protein
VDPSLSGGTTRRDDAEQAGTLRSWEVAAAVLALATFLALRWRLLTPRAVVLGWHSDAAIYGLAAQRILERGRIDVFFWGQNYIGPLTSLAAAAVALIRRFAFDSSAGVDALALRIAAMSQTAVGTVFFWLGLRAALGRLAALPCLLWLVIGPLYVFESSVTPRTEQTSFLCSGVLFWIAARSFAGFRRPGVFDTPRGCLFAGLVSGFGWWMDQSVVFILLPIVVVLALRSRAWADFAPRIRPLDRLLIRTERLGWRSLPRTATLTLLAWQAVLVTLPVIALSAKSWSPPAIDVAVACVLLLLATQLALERYGGSGIRRRAFRADALKALRAVLPRGAFLAAGFLLGYSPVLAGRLLGWYPITYSRRKFTFGLDNLFQHLSEMGRWELWRWIGADRSRPGIVFAIGCAFGLGLLMWERRGEIRAFWSLRFADWGAPALVGCVLFVSLVFYTIALRHGGDTRYIGVAVPAAYGLAAAGFVGASPAARRRSNRFVRGIALAVVVVCGLASLQGQAARHVSKILSEPDPRPLLEAIRDHGYRICYAGYWSAYKLQFLSEERVRFIPYKSQSRSRDGDRALELQPGEKCLLLPDGTFRAFLPSDVTRPIARPSTGRK